MRDEVGRSSRVARLVPAEQVEEAAAAQYTQMKREAVSKQALAPANHSQVVRLRAIAERLVPHALPWNPRARDWRWGERLVRTWQREWREAYGREASGVRRQEA